MKTKHIISIVSITLLLLGGCANKPTNPSQITSAYVSTIQYEKYSCNRLAIEYNNLVRRENILVNAQNERIKSSQVQEFWLGYGTGDGIEAAELANVRGDKAAVRKAASIKGCKL